MISQTVPKLPEARQREIRKVSVCGGAEWKGGEERLPAQTGEHSAEIGGFELNYRLLICGASGLCVHSPVYLCVRGTR